MKREYVKPEILQHEQLEVNQAIAACSYSLTGRLQNSAERQIAGGPNAYGYGTMGEAIWCRWPNYPDVDQFDGYWGVIGPIYLVTITVQGTTYQFYWEDFDGNGSILPAQYEAEEWAPRPDKTHQYPANPNLYPTEGTIESLLLSDNFQGVSGGVPGDFRSYFDTTTGKPIIAS